jgi:hypothetical protein
MEKYRFGSARVPNSAGYHFSRFRKSGWRGLRLWHPGEYAAERKRMLKLTGLYYMGILLMVVGFLICFNAIFGNHSDVRPYPVTPKSSAGISAENSPGSGFKTTEGRGD